MTGAFPIVVIVVAAIGVLGALAALLSGRRTWEAYGRDHLLKDSDLDTHRPSVPTTPVATAQRDDEIRQMLRARNARRRRRGQPELDVEAELRRLTAAAPERTEVDAELREEIRALVIARHRRRARRDPSAAGPLDIEAEVAREIARLER